MKLYKAKLLTCSPDVRTETRHVTASESIDTCSSASDPRQVLKYCILATQEFKHRILAPQPWKADGWTPAKASSLGCMNISFLGEIKPTHALVGHRPT